MLWRSWRGRDWRTIEEGRRMLKLGKVNGRGEIEVKLCW